MEERWPRITKTRRDDEAARHRFSWDHAREGLDGLPGGGWNIAHEAVFRHAQTQGDKVAIRWLGRSGERLDITYADLAVRVAKFANALSAMGVGEGERVYALLPRVPELVVAALGTLAHRSVFCPLYADFGPDPIASRIRIGEGRVLVTTPALYDRKVRPVRVQLESLRDVMLVDESWNAAMDVHPSTFPIGPTAPNTPALLHFTSGTTGAPKGALHVHEAVLMHHFTGRAVLDLRPDDVFWCNADPGWVTGTSYGIIAPLVCGVTIVMDEADFDADRWYALLARERVSVWYTAPAAIRKLMKAGAEVATPHDLSSLRFLASVGEPLNPDAVVWSQQVFGTPFHDTWWQTETGAILIANTAAMEVRPGSMGKPLPGVEVAIVRHTPAGVTIIERAGEEGELAVKAGWPSMFVRYWNEPGRYDKCFVDGWYLTGDLAKRDADGYVWFVGRTDDLITSAGRRIGPFEVESALLEHPCVAEVGVIGKPDPIAGNIVKAFVALKRGCRPSTELVDELLAWARERLGAAVAPRELSFVAALPRTRSGKVLRRLLRSRELGLPEGDLSMFEHAK